LLSFLGSSFFGGNSGALGCDLKTSLTTNFLGTSLLIFPASTTVAFTGSSFLTGGGLLTTGGLFTTATGGGTYLTSSFLLEIISAGLF
jgi:hypothetical protein